MRMIRTFGMFATAACVAVLSSCGSSPATPSGTPAPASSAPSLSTRYPNSIVVLGHSGATGYGSDPASPESDARQNSWATGTNAAVNSIYLRLLAVNPAIKDHATNEAESGSDVTALAGQIDNALATKPLPELFLIQSVDNDMHCDGTDQENYAPFGKKFGAALQRIAQGAPQARILVVSSPWATAQNYTQVVGETDDGRAANMGSGPCDAFGSKGQLQPKHLAYVDSVAAHYYEQLAASCAKVPHCRYDGGALHRMRITSEDITSDFNHLSISGQAKQAAVEWKVLAKDF